MKRIQSRSRSSRRGMVLFSVLITILVLLWGGMLLATRAATDLQIAASGRRGAVTYAEAEGTLGLILSDDRITLPFRGASPSMAPAPGFAPDPGSPSLSAEYPVTPLTPGTDVRAEVRYLREGPAGETSAILARSLVYEVRVSASYDHAGARVPVSSEFYRLAPKPEGYVSAIRHYH